MSLVRNVGEDRAELVWHWSHRPYGINHPSTHAYETIAVRFSSGITSKLDDYTVAIFHTDNFLF